jgi:hypothetical protein
MRFCRAKALSSLKQENKNAKGAEVQQDADDRQQMQVESKPKTLLESFRSGKMKTVAD